MFQFLISSLPSALVWFWPSLCAVAAIAIANARPFRLQHRFSATAVVFALAASTALALHAAADPINNRLGRDTVAFVLIGTLAPTTAGLVAFIARRNSAWLRGIAPLLAGILPLASSPLVLLLVHCTSGDCL